MIQFHDSWLCVTSRRSRTRPPKLHRAQTGVGDTELQGHHSPFYKSVYHQNDLLLF